MGKKRANPRFSFFAEAEFTLSDGASAWASFRIERVGLLCRYNPARSHPELRLLISDGMSSCELPGKVIYMNDGGGLGVFDIGVMFGELNVDQHSVIGKWLHERAGTRILRPS